MPLSPDVLGPEEGQQLRRSGLALDDAVAQVRPVESGNERRRSGGEQPLDDLPPGRRIGRRGERHARHGGPALAQQAEREVLGPEVVPPLGDAVSLVDREECQRHGVEQLEEARRDQPFGRDVDQIELAPAEALLDIVRLARGLRRVQVRRGHAILLERRDLVAHQRDERRDHDARPGQVERRQLVADRLAGAGRHHDQGIAALFDRGDRFALEAAEDLEAEYPLQRLQRAVGHRSGLYHSRRVLLATGDGNRPRETRATGRPLPGRAG